ncbi:MAG: hypothetical protein GXY85_12610 [Candidatus Brocadiaceae bacterium]|nr:hypothetical protein [Candidatus Brocadiaceae bacterium]
MSTGGLLFFDQSEFLADEEKGAWGRLYVKGLLPEYMYPLMGTREGWRRLPDEAYSAGETPGQAGRRGFFEGWYAGQVNVGRTVLLGQSDRANEHRDKLWRELGLEGTWEGTASDISAGVFTAAAYSAMAVFGWKLAVHYDSPYVSRWGRPGLQRGDWVMRGPKSVGNFLRSGKYQPTWFPGSNIPAQYSAGETFLVGKGTVSWPTGVDIIKGFLGQGRYMPCVVGMGGSLGLRRAPDALSPVGDGTHDAWATHHRGEALAWPDEQPPDYERVNEYVRLRTEAERYAGPHSSTMILDDYWRRSADPRHGLDWE